jgi:hypothetical protein
MSEPVIAESESHMPLCKLDGRRAGATLMVELPPPSRFC